MAGFGGCGSGSSSDKPVEVTTTGKSVAVALTELQNAFAADDVKSICVLMTRAAQVDVGHTGHKQPTTCARDMKRLIGMIDGGGGWKDSEPPKLVRVRGAGHRRIATIRDGDGWRADVPFAKDAGKWKLAAFVGTMKTALEQRERHISRVTFPASAGDPVQATDADGTPCPPIRLTRNLRLPSSALDYYPHAAGGCLMDVKSDGRLPVRMLSPFGEFKFDDCSLEFRVRVGPDGRTWTEDWQGDGPDKGGCADLIDCISPASAAINPPWKGRLEPAGAGRFTHRMRMCLRTCVGFFVGDWITTLRADGDGWRVDPTGGGVTGFRMDGRFDVDSEDGLMLEARPGGGQRVGAAVRSAFVSELWG
jgi:hypothetical protein